MISLFQKNSDFAFALSCMVIQSTSSSIYESVSTYVLGLERVFEAILQWKHTSALLLHEDVVGVLAGLFDHVDFLLGELDAVDD